MPGRRASRHWDECVPRYARVIDALALGPSPLLDGSAAVVVRTSTFVCGTVHAIRVAGEQPRRARLATVLRTGNGWGALAVEAPDAG
jgi:hypothetical protein